MKRMKKGLMAICAVAVMLSGCQSYDDISVILGADVSAGQVVTQYDSHGGFHGDGERYMEFQFADDTFEDTIREDNTWHSLPIREDAMKAILYGLETEESTYGPYIQNEEGEPLLPQIENGYYFFYDRHGESKNPFDSTEILERSSFNFTVAVYDADTDRLYYAELDT